MNSNQDRNLTQKQQELVKRLERIRNNRETVKQTESKPQKQRDSTDSQRRNENMQQKRQAPTRSKKKVDHTKTRPVKQSKFARPAEPAPVKVEPKVEYKPRVARPKNKVQRPHATKKKKDEEHYVKQLTNGKKLSQALILSEILDKPVALRRR